MSPAPVRTNEVGDVVLDDARQLQALADPVALAAFTWLQRFGPGTVERLAAELSEPEAEVAARLADLRSAGLVDRDVEDWGAPSRVRDVLGTSRTRSRRSSGVA